MLGVLFSENFSKKKNVNLYSKIFKLKVKIKIQTFLRNNTPVNIYSSNEKVTSAKT